MRKILFILFIFISNYAFSQYDMLFDTVRFEAGGIIWRYESGDDTVFINNDTITPSLGITLVITGTPNQIAILNPSTIPSINVNLSPIIDGDQSLATVDAIYDFVTTQIGLQLTYVDASNISNVRFVFADSSEITASFDHLHISYVLQSIYENQVTIFYDSIAEHRNDLTAIYDSLVIHNDTLKKHRIDINALEASSHDAVTMSGVYDYITLSGQDIIRGQVDYDTDISNLPSIPTVNDPTITIQGTAVVSSPETFTLNQAGAKTITINDTQAAAQTLSTDNTPGDISLSDGGGYLTLNVDDADASTTNELQTLTGDVSSTGTTTLTTTIGNDKILESMLKSVNTPTDEYYLTYESTTGDFEWQVGNNGTVTEVSSLTTNQLTVTDGTTVPKLSILTSAVVNGGTSLATGDQIYDFAATLLGSYVPDTRTLTLGRDGTSPITINGAQIDVTYDLSANRTWTVGHSTISASPILDSNPDTVVTYLSFDGFGHVNQYKFAAIYLDSLVPYNGAINHLDMGAFDITATEIHATTVNTTDLWLAGVLYDKDDDAGTLGQILSSTVTGTDWIDAPGVSVTNQANNRIVTATASTDVLNAEGSLQFSPGTLLMTNSSVNTISLQNTTAFSANAILGGLWFSDGGYTYAQVNGYGITEDDKGELHLKTGTSTHFSIDQNNNTLISDVSISVGDEAESTLDLRGSMSWQVDTKFEDNVIVSVESDLELPLISTSTGRVYEINATVGTWDITQNTGETGSKIILNNAAAVTNITPLPAGYYKAFNNDTYWIIVGLRSY